MIASPMLTGCSQTEHRLDADREAYCTIAERNNDHRWSESDLNIDMDARSRYFDPYNPDCSPMPMDDPASHRYMQCVDGLEGWQHWGRNGTRARLENPQWRVRLAEYTELTEDNAVELDVDSAVRLAYVNSPLNQRALETLYLTSLDVTGERFRLDTQLFGGTAVDYAHQGGVAPASIGFNPLINNYVIAGPSRRPEANRLTVTNDLTARRRLATAGEVLVGFANSFAFEFTGNDVSLASSLVNFSFVQPLLQGAGRDIALEQLTLSERRLLANLRAYSQFRQGFFTQIVIGELGVSAPERFGQDTSLQSFSGFGGVGGYLGLLQQSQQIRNTEDNLRLQLRTLDRLEALYENELIDIVQVDQFRQNIEVTRASLLDRTNALELAVDNFTTQTLGLPSDLPIELDEELVKQFQLIPPETPVLSEELLNLQQRIGKIGELASLIANLKFLDTQLGGQANRNLVDVDLTFRQLKSVVDAASRQLADLPEQIAKLKGPDNDFQNQLDPPQRAAFEKIIEYAQNDSEQIALEFAETSRQLDGLVDSLTEENYAELAQSNADWLAEVLALSRGVVLIQYTANEMASEPQGVLAEAERLIEPIRELFVAAQEDVQRMEDVASVRERAMSAAEKTRFRSDRQKLNDRLNDLQSGDSGLDKSIAELERLQAASTPENQGATVRGLTAWVQSSLQLVERLALVPAQARLENITLEEVEMEPEAAFQIAVQNRLDFMNGRAALVDSWRAIQVAADALQSNLTITGGGDVGTAKNNPVDFRAATSTLRLGVEFDAPLARLLERNGYREALINYQRNRRNLIQSQDALQLGLRALLRTLRQRKLQLEIQRRAVTIALRRVDQTQLSLLTPPPQGQPGVRPQINPTTAINLLGAQSALLTSRNSLLAAWLDYYAARLRLYRELGVMQLDPTGKWIENSLDFGRATQPNEPLDMTEPLPPAVPIRLSNGDVKDRPTKTESSKGRATIRPVTYSVNHPDEGSTTQDRQNPFAKLAGKIMRFMESR